MAAATPVQPQLIYKNFDLEPENPSGTRLKYVDDGKDKEWQFEVVKNGESPITYFISKTTQGWQIRQKDSAAIYTIQDSSHHLKIDSYAKKISFMRKILDISRISFIVSGIFAVAKLVTQTKKFTWLFPGIGLVVPVITYPVVFFRIFYPAFDFLNSSATLMDLKDRNVQQVNSNTPLLCNLDHYKA